MYRFSKERITEMRSRRGLTKEQLAIAMQVSSSSISRWENGKAIPSAIYIASLANALHADVESFYIEKG